MRLLLDTHVLLWWRTGNPQLSSVVRPAIGEEAKEIPVSAASAWEISTKVRLRKLPVWGRLQIALKNSSRPALSPPVRSGSVPWG